MKKIQYNREFILLMILAALILANLIISWNNLMNPDGSIVPLIIMTVMEFFLIAMLLRTKSPVFVFKDKPNNQKEQQAQKANVKEPVQYTEQKNPDELVNNSLKNLTNTTNINSFGEKILSNLAHEYNIMQGIFYCFDEKAGNFNYISGYAVVPELIPGPFSEKEGFAGQAAFEKSIIVLKDIPGDYRIVQSGLGKSQPACIYFIPLVHQGQTQGLIEFSVFKELSEIRLNSLNDIIHMGGKLLNEKIKSIG